MNKSLLQRLQVEMEAGPAKIEVGGPFVGAKFVSGSPLPTRIAFFYPVANTIDLRDVPWGGNMPQVLYLGLKIGDGPGKLVGTGPFAYKITPYSVSFQDSDEEKIIDINYRFCKNKPAMIAEIEITNNGKATVPFEVYTHMLVPLRTCHSYDLKDKAWTEFDKKGYSI
ncbi:MAG: hypothetical protein J7M18_02500, partial [Candidatus Eremiobacteraeota bacterium]|nr:hypothetical protein [Candidatus Eremiobacteraeota bacterium]